MIKYVIAAIVGILFGILPSNKHVPKKSTEQQQHHVTSAPQVEVTEILNKIDDEQE